MPTIQRHTRFLALLAALFLWCAPALAQTTQDSRDYPIEFSVGAGYSESLGVFAVASADNLFQPGGIGAQLKGGQYGVEAAVRARLELTYGVSAILHVGAAYTWTGFFGLFGRAGLEYRPEFYRQVAVFAEYGPVSYFTDRSYFAWSFGVVWYL